MLVSAARFARYRRVRAHFSCASCGTNRAGEQIPHPHQVVWRRREGENPPHLVNSTMPHLSQQRDRLQPSENLLDPLPLLRADPIARVPRRPLIDRAPARPIRVLRPVRRHSHIAALRYEIFGVVRLVASHRHAMLARNLLQHHQRSIPFCKSYWLGTTQW